jgi:antirestriction protein
MAKVYVGTYQKYNNGSIEGAWLDLEDYADHDEFIEACMELHKDEEDPELMFQDYEEFPERFYGESSIDADLWDWLELDDDDREMWDAFLECFGGGTLENARDAYQGKFESDEAFAEDYIESTGMLSDVPDNLRNYFDTERFARDLMYDFSASDGHYFSSNW